MSLSDQKRNYLLLLVLIITGVAIYLPGFTIPYYSDDFEVVHELPALNVFSYFLQSHPGDHFYRPLQAAILGMIQYFFYLDPIPVHIVLIGLHVILSWMVYLFMTEYGFPGKHAVIGSFFMLISQANAHALLNNDTISQVIGTLFGCLSLLLLYYCHKHRTGCIYQDKYYYLSIAAFLFSLLSKETNAAIVLSLLILTFLFYRNKYSLKKAFFLSGSHSLLFIITLAVYLIARSLIISEVPPDVSLRYEMSPGFNIFVNFTQLLFASLVPVSSVTTFLAYESGDNTLFILIIMTTLLLGAYVGHGIRRSKHLRIATVIGGFAVISLLPVLLLLQVSELYVYNAMPFVAVLFGAGLGVQLEKIRWAGVKKATVPVLLLLLCISHVFAIRGKETLMYYNGIRSTYLLEQITNHSYRVPVDGNLLLLNPKSDELDYSVYIMSGFNVLDNALERINFMSNRYDISVKIIDESELARYDGTNNSIILSLRDDIVFVYRRDENQISRN